MPTLSEILDEVYAELSLSETIDRNPIDIELSKDEHKEVWKIKTEVEVGSFQKEVSLLISFEDFLAKYPQVELKKDILIIKSKYPHDEAGEIIEFAEIDACPSVSIFKTLLSEPDEFFIFIVEGVSEFPTTFILSKDELASKKISTILSPICCTFLC